MTLMERLRKRQEMVPMRRTDDGNPIAALRRELDRTFEDFWQGWPSPSTWIAAGEGVYLPQVDVSETDDAIEVTAELPGVSEKDIDVSLSADGTMLTISGEKRYQEEKQTAASYRSERRYGTFRRTLTLPCAVDPEKVDARSKDGVLRIKLPKESEEAQGIRHIAVKPEK